MSTYFGILFSENASEIIGLNGSLQDVLTAMRSFPENVVVITTCCNALWSLTVNGKLKNLHFRLHVRHISFLFNIFKIHLRTQ